MSEETITVADVSAGAGGDETGPGTPVELPVVDVLTGRGFVTGKSGAGKSNTASIVVEKLLGAGYPVMVVDADGEYYGLKEEFEVLHAGADEECDIQVSPEHAEKLATLALEGNVPVILDVSGYLDGDVADELVRETARHLFAKEKKLKKPFLLLIEECHEYIPEGGGLDETGRMLIKVGKRGRKHGLGLVGISQRPADVKKDFITQCDWLVWHRLTWDNDTAVVGRILDREHADAVEDLSDGEAFLDSDWAGGVRRVQFRRKSTFDAGATPGLDDVERPELKSVSDDLVSDLREITDERERRESELADLRQTLDRKNRRIRELEAELEEARDLKQMADKFAQALLQKAEAPYRDDPVSAPATAEEGAVTAPGSTAESDDGGAVESNGHAEGCDDHDEHGASRGATPGETAAGGGVEPTAPNATRRGAPDHGATRTPASDDGGEAPTMETVALELGTREALVSELAGRIDDLDDLGQAMLEHYRREGTAEPVDAHVAAGGRADSTLAYSRNRALRRAGLIRHAGRGVYRYAVPDLVDDACDGRLDDATLAALVETVEERFAAPDATAAWREPVPDAERAEAEIVADREGDAEAAFRTEDAEVVESTAEEADASPDDAVERQLDRADGNGTDPADHAEIMDS